MYSITHLLQMHYSQFCLTQLEGPDLDFGGGGIENVEASVNKM
jgi:hypothetical protein